MNLAEILEIVTYMLGIITIIVGGLGWLGKSFLQRALSDLRLNELSELKPNGGSSMKDVLNQVQKEIGWMRLDITETKESIAELRGSFNQHVKETEE